MRTIPTSPIHPTRMLVLSIVLFCMLFKPLSLSVLGVLIIRYVPCRSFGVINMYLPLKKSKLEVLGVFPVMIFPIFLSLYVLLSLKPNPF